MQLPAGHVRSPLRENVGSRPEECAGRERVYSAAIPSRRRGVDGECRRVHQARGDHMLLKNEAEFHHGGRTAGDILADVKENIQGYVDLIRAAIFNLNGTKTTPTCPGIESMRLQSERANAVMGYWQDGLKETMPKREFKGKG
ncbi:unnamed protein product [Pylaiella littoralis]